MRFPWRVSQQFRLGLSLACTQSALTEDLDTLCSISQYLERSRHSLRILGRAFVGLSD